MIRRWFDNISLVSYLSAANDRRSISRAREQLKKRKPSSSRPTQPRQLLVDVSVICRHDAGTGIQRIVRIVFSQLLEESPTGYVVRPVMATRKRPYRYIDWNRAKGGAIANEGAEIVVKPGDVFLGLDLSAHIIPAHRHQLAEWKAQGCALHFMVYDILPLRHPEWFSDKLGAAFRRWIKAVAILADSAICISRVVEADIADWFEDRYTLAPGSVPTRVIPMGWDFSVTASSQGKPPNFDQTLSKIRQRKTALMVGTLEPRKGHAQVLDAFEQLWHSGKEYNLVIVGRPGWKTEGLQARLRNHTQRNQHLFWLDDASDEALLELYKACDGVVVASLAEGFGLPIIEAIGHGKPVLARDLPVFRHRVQSGIDYFTAHDGEGLSTVLAEWLEHIKSQAITTNRREQLFSWKDTVSELVAGFDATPNDSTNKILVKEMKFLGTV